MLKLSHNPSLTAPFENAISAIARRVANDIRRTPPYELIWWFFAASVVASSISRAFGDMPQPLSYVLTIAGTAGCAWAWLFSRALFRASKPVAPWTVVAVAAVIAVESFWALSSGARASGSAGELLRIAENAASMICIAALVLVFVEAFAGYGPSMSRTERRFRHVFVGVFGAIIAVSMLWTWNADDMTIAGQWEEAVLTLCATVGLIGSRVAIAFRNRHPLATETGRRRATAPRPISAGDDALAKRILEAIQNEQLLTTPDLKIAKFAEALGEQDYKITQCITGPLRYRNFNHFINAHRVDYAKRALSNTRNDNRSISSIAFDCGYNSIGPFNRAFKQLVGMTPREFRAARRENSTPV